MWETNDMRTISTSIWQYNPWNAIVDHIPAVCSNDSKVAIPQTQDLTDTQVIKFDFSRKANIVDDQRRQLAVMAYVVFNNDERQGSKNLVEILAGKTV